MPTLRLAAAATLAATAAGLLAAASGAHPSLAAPLPLPSPSLPVLGGGQSPQPPPPSPTSRSGAAAQPSAAPAQPAGSPAALAGAAAAPARNEGTSPRPSPSASAGLPLPRSAGLRGRIPGPLLAAQIAAGLLGALMVLFAAGRILALSRERRAYAADPALAEVARALETAREAELPASIAVVAPSGGGGPAAQRAVAALVASTVDPEAALVQRPDGSLAAVAAAPARELEARLESARRRAARHGLDFRYRAVGDDGRSSAGRLVRRATRLKLG